MSTPYTSKDIHCFLENEQSLLENDQHGESQSTIALATHAKPVKWSNTPICRNPICKKSGHTTDFCIKLGGDGWEDN